MKNFSKILVTSAVTGSVIFGNLPMVFANPQQAEIEAKICENITELQWFEIVNNDMYWIYNSKNPDISSSSTEYINNYFKNLSTITAYGFPSQQRPSTAEITGNIIKIDGAEFTTRPLKNDETITFLKKIGNDFYYTINLFDDPTQTNTAEIYKNQEKVWEVKSRFHPLVISGWEVIVTDSGDIYATSANWDDHKSQSIYKISNGNTEKIKDTSLKVDMFDMTEWFHGDDISIHTINNDFYISSFYTAGSYDTDFKIEKNGQPLCEKSTTPHPLEEKITNLPALDAVTLADEAKITEMKKEFDALSDEDKKKISAENQKKLKDLIAKITELKITDLNDKISKLPEVDKVVESNKKTINKLKTEYDKLSETDKQKISAENRKKLDELAKKVNEQKTPTPPSAITDSGGGYISATSPSNPTPTPKEPTKIETPKTENATKLFPKFIAKKSQAVTDLRDTKLADLNKRFGIINEKTRNEALSRGEFLKIVLDSANVNLSSISTEKLTFADVSKNTEIAKYIAFARENNIISGYSDNTFRADAKISRAEATKILMESLNVKIAEKNTTFADVNTENTLGKYIQTAYDNFILNGTSKTTFEPNRSISRGELIKIIYNILN